jgi:lactate racemase
MPKLTIPYESLDPLTIGASDDESKISRETLELEVPDENLLAAIYPEEPEPVGNATEAARAALESPVSGPRFSELLASASKVAIVIDNQFRPTPTSKLLPPVLDAVEAAGKPAVLACANGKVFPMSETDIEQKIGTDNLARLERLGIPFHQNEPRNADAYTYVGVSSRGTPVWLLTVVAECDLKITIGQAQSNHWGAGGGGKLILPGVVSDETVESNHCAFVPSPQTHYGAYAGPMRSDIDEVATMCGLQCTMNVLLDTRGRVIDCIFGAHPQAHRLAIERFNDIYAYEHSGEKADIAVCGVFAPTDHLFFHTR